MKIATISFNPAIDQTVFVKDFRPNTVNRAQSMYTDAAGKGVNVASFLADYGLPVAVTGFLGEENAEIFDQLFARKQIDDHFVRLSGRTRIGIKIVDEVNQQTTDINLPGLAPAVADLDTLLKTIDRLATDCNWFVLAGKLPPSVSATMYATIIAQLKAHGKHVALDTSLEALRHGVLAGPTIIKPNIDELQQLVGATLPDEAAVERAARRLLDHGIQTVVVSMGERGAIFVDQQRSLSAIPPSVTVKSTVGAGDAMVAGLIAGHVQGLSLADSARLATAFSVGAITRLGAHLPAADTLQRYLHHVSVHALDHTQLSGSER
jgi:1-phosphofructokinase